MSSGNSCSCYESIGSNCILKKSPLSFAIGVASGLTGDKGVAALAATVGFLIMNVVTGIFMPDTLPEKLYANILRIETLQTSVFGGVIIGLLTAYLYNKFYKLLIFRDLSFFAGARFVPIITALSSILVGIIFSPSFGHQFGI